MSSWFTSQPSGWLEASGNIGPYKENTMLKILISLCLIIIVFFSLAPCPYASDQSSKDAEYRTLIIGTWIYEDSTGDAYSYSEQQFRKSGESVGNGYFIKNGQKVVFKYRGNWKIVNGMITETIIESTFPKLIGTSSVDHIISIDASKYTFKNKDGKIFSFKRK